MRTMLAVAVACLCLAVAPSAQGYDLTGTWIGKYSCKGFDGAKFSSGSKSSTFKITQSGNQIAVDLDNGEYRYNGGAIPDTAKPEKGEAVFLECANDSVPFTGGDSEIIRVAVKTKPGDVKATLKGTSIFEDTLFGVGTCKYTFKRVDTAAPTILGCTI